MYLSENCAKRDRFYGPIDLLELLEKSDDFYLEA